MANQSYSDKEYLELENKYTQLEKDYNKSEIDRSEAIRKYNALKKSKYMWIVLFLEKLFCKK